MRSRSRLSWDGIELRLTDAELMVELTGWSPSGSEDSRRPQKRGRRRNEIGRAR